MGTQSTIAGIPVYVISLAYAHVRRANMTARLGAIGLPFQFVDAIDGGQNDFLTCSTARNQPI